MKKIEHLLENLIRFFNKRMVGTWEKCITRSQKMEDSKMGLRQTSKLTQETIDIPLFAEVHAYYN